MLINIRLIISVFVIIVSGATIAAEKADYVFKNGAVYTIEGKNSKAQAIAIKGKQLSFVGSNKGVQAYIGDNTQVIDLHGKMLLPGFVEAHFHPTNSFIATGAELLYDSVDDILHAVKQWAESHPDAKVVMGFGWRYSSFSKNGPNKTDLDRIISDRPVFLIATDGHSAWLNSKALEMAGITAKTPDPMPPFSYFKRDDKTSEPTGWLVEVPAEQFAISKLQPTTMDTVTNAMKEFMPKFSAAGITSVFDAGTPVIPADQSFQIYQNLERENLLPFRVVGSYYWNNSDIKDPVAEIRALRNKYHSELVQARTLKINMDGGENQHTAVMIEPYADMPGFHGDFAINLQSVNQAVSKAQAEGIDTHCHCYGDGAVRAYLDAIALARKAYPKSLSRHTVAHAIFMTNEELARLAKLNVTVQTSAQWATPDPANQLMLDIIGKKVVFKEYMRFNSVEKAGGRLAFGTDWPAAGYVVTYRPLDAIQVALTRSILTQYGKKQFLPIMPPENETITLDQALKANTLNAAYVLGKEKEIGSLKVGKLADIVVLEKDLYKMPPKEISATKVQLTMMNGKITHRDGL